MKTMRVIMGTPSERQKIWDRNMAIWDQNDYIEGAKEEGFAEGRAEGRAEGEKNMALNLYKLGIPIDMIAKGANVSADTVKSWIDSCDKTKENA